MVGEILTSGDIGRLKAYGANAPTTSTIPMFYQGKAYTVTPDQIASGASAVDGPSSATDNALARFDGTTGKIIQNSAVTIADTTGSMSFGPGATITMPSATTNKGALKVTPTDNNSGNFSATITNDDGLGQDTTYTIPVSPGATAKFITSNFNGTQTIENGALTVSFGDITAGGNFVNSAVAKTLVLKQGANGKTGTFTANGATPVSVSNTSITANSGIIFTLKTVGGTVGAYPAIQTITPTTGFTVACTALDTSVYNYHIIESQA